MGALIRPATHPRLPLEPADEEHNATIDSRAAELAARRQARALAKAERQLRAARKAEAKAAKIRKRKASAKRKAKPVATLATDRPADRPLARPQGAKGKAKSAARASRGSRPRKGAIVIPLPRGKVDRRGTAQGSRVEQTNAGEAC